MANRSLAAGEPRWQAGLAVIAAIALYALLPGKYIFTIGPSRYLLPALEAALLVALIAANRFTSRDEPRDLRYFEIGLIAVVNITNAVSLGVLIYHLLHHAHQSGEELIGASSDIWLTNAIVFGLWYWVLDRGGPFRREHGSGQLPDFLFPQMTAARSAPPGWEPRFVDYLYVAFTNAAAFSPTDTMPLTARAKLLMLVQSMISLLTLVLVAARAVNILR